MFTTAPPPASVAGHSSDEVYRITQQPSTCADEATCAISTIKQGKTVNTAGTDSLDNHGVKNQILN